MANLATLKKLPPSPQQAKVLAFLKKRAEKNVIPTHGEISKALKITTGASQSAVRQLVIKGYAKKNKAATRNVILTGKA